MRQISNLWRMTVMALVAIAAVTMASTQPTSAQRLDPGAEQPGADDAASNGNELPRRVVIRFLTDSDFPPFNFYDEDGVLVGFNIDLARAICLELGTSCDIKTKPWEELFGGLKSGEADAVIAAHKVTADAKQIVDFTDRYFHTPGRFVALKSYDDAEVNPSGLYSKRIAVARGTSHEAYLKAFFRDSTLVPFESPDLAREALINGEADVLFGDALSLAFWLNGTNSRQCCTFVGGPFLEPLYFSDGIAIAVPKTDPQIRTMINEALKRIRASGRFEELVQRYFPFRIY